MKNKFSKLISAILVLLVVTLSASMLLACNPTKKEEERRERDRRARLDSVVIVENVFLNSVNDKWSVDLDNSQLIELDGKDNFDAADYIVALGWTQFVGDLLINSSLQTGKLQALAEVAQSEDGKALIENFSENAELILPLFKRVDFTPTDISGLVYDLLCALASESGQVFDGIIAKAGEISAQARNSPATYQRMSVVIAEMGDAKNKFVPTTAERDEMLAAFEEAKGPMNALVEFVYNMSVGAIDEDLFETLLGGDGALAGISNSEIITLIGTLRENVADLKNALAGDAVADLNGAFDLIINKFDGAASSVLYAQIVQYAKTAYMLVDAIPFMCDLAYSAGEVFMQETLLDQFKAGVGKDLNEYAQFANASIITAKIVMKVTETFSKDDFEKLIADLYEQSMGDYRKSVPLVAVDLMLNLSHIIGQLDKDDLGDVSAVHPNLDRDTLGQLINTLMMLFDNSFEKFKAAYDAYLIDIADGRVDDGTYGALRSAASFFNSFGIENKIDINSDTKAWAEWYINNAPREINKIVDANNGKVKDDIFAFIGDFYAENSEVKATVAQLANMPLVSDSISESEYKQYMSLSVNGRIVGLISLIYSGK